MPKKQKILKKVQFVLLFILCLVISIFIVQNCMKYSLIDYDDIVTSYPINEFSLKDIFLEGVYHGKYIGSFLTRITAFTLPDIFNIHPVIWTQTYGALIKAVFFYLTCCFCALFMYYKRDKMTLPLTALLILIFEQEKLIFKYQNDLYTSFFCFFFPFLFFFIFWYYFFKLFIEQKSSNKVPDTVNFIVILFFAFLNGISSECTAIISFFALSIFVLTSILKRNLGEFIISILAFIMNTLGCFVYFTSNAFKSELLIRGIIKGIDGYIQYWNENHTEFFKKFLEVFLFDYSGFIIIIISLIIMINYQSVKENKNKINLCVLVYLISIICFKLSLFFALKHNSGCFYVIHEDIIWQVEFAFMALILFELSFIEQRKKIILCLLLIFTFVLIRDYVNKEKYPEGSREKIYHTRYLNERYLAYYAYKNSDKVYLYREENPYEIQNSRDVLNIQYAFVRPHPYSKNYYGKSYELDDVIFFNNYEALYKKYLENGGCEISEEEFKQADFNKLLNKQYVLTCK